jgi:phosphoglycerol transferase MdoB-like AlkP superfamily enzyme
LILIFVFVAAVVVFARVLRDLVRAYRLGARKYWYFYNTIIICTALTSLFSLTAFRHTPEFTIARTFYDFLFGDNKNIELSPLIAAKLERFGLKYDTSKFKVAHKEKVFDQPQTLLPANFKNNPPNIVIVFFESFSSRLTSVYNPKFPGLTPGLERMAKDKNTTIFKNFYNGSTPTITGIIAELCSVYPPTGQNEINFQNLFKDHRLLCLPKILKEHDGYNYASQITAVPKTYSHKDLIFSRMGMDEVFGQDELAKYIEGEPLSWGYSDHQMFPVLFDFMRSKPQPFLMTLSTVDVHTPFTLTKDAVSYGDYQSPLLDSVHSSDDAFGKFWDEFVKSKFYDNTILITVADHAIFPVSYPKELFPELYPSGATYYDEITFMMYVPKNILPKTVDTYASSVDFTPTILEILNVNVPNSFEGHSIFSDRRAYPSILGLQEFGLYINELLPSGKRAVNYDLFSRMDCAESDYTMSTSSPLTLCEFRDYFNWKKQMFSEGRFWEF